MTKASLIQQKLAYVISYLDDLSRSLGRNDIRLSGDSLPERIEQFRARHPHLHDGNVTASCVRWITGKVNAPNGSSSNLLAEFLTGVFSSLPEPQKSMKFEGSNFGGSFSLREFKRKFPGSGSAPNFLLPLDIDSARMQGLIARNLNDAKEMLSGWKLVFRIAFENTGRVAREVIKFDVDSVGTVTFKWWFQAIGGTGQLHRRVNTGRLLPMQHSYLFLGLHDSQDDDEPRFRMAVIQKKPMNLATKDVLVGIATSTNAQDFYPVSGRTIWLTIRNEYVKDEEGFLDRTVGFFTNVERSFGSAPISKQSIDIIQRVIRNSPYSGEYLLSASHATIRPSEQTKLASEDWLNIINAFTPSTGSPSAPAEATEFRSAGEVNDGDKP